MTENRIGGYYPVDGESFAHGKAQDWEVVYDSDDIVAEIVEALIDDPEAVNILLGSNIEGIAQFLGEDYAERLQARCDEDLIDDDYGDGKHFMLVEDFVIDNCDIDSIVYEYTELV